MVFLHTCIRVFDLEQSIKFYKMLGLVESRRKDHSDNGFILVYMTDIEYKYELELTYNIGSERYEIGNGYSHLALGTMDIEREHAKHKEKGYEVTELKGLPGSKPNYYFITDPDGYKVEIINIGK